MIQSNDWVGFENFSIYQQRTGLFSNDTTLEKLKAKMAVMSCIEQNVERLELRITPKNTAKENYEELKFLDDAIGLSKKMRDMYYYVLHFIKRPEEENSNSFFCSFRHASLRHEIKIKVMALLDLRHTYPETAARILGIDAASQEIGCRPEIFAQGFRTLHRDTSFVYSEKGFVKLPQLRVTYHVGEDFLDVVDGLRAIDEAILFLNLDCGDRLGHAIALGISVPSWYKAKQNYISLQKQDYLDNIVWLYHALIRYQISDMDILKNHIEKEFYKYFGEIYGRNIDEKYISAIQNDAKKKEKSELYQRRYYYNDGTYMTALETNGVNHSFPKNFDVRKKDEVSRIYGRNIDEKYISAIQNDTKKKQKYEGIMNFDIHSYYDAWKLRGDAPELYQRGYYYNDGTYMTALETNAVNYSFPKNFDVRKKDEVSMLYYFYHYNKEVRKEGKKIVHIKVDHKYIKAVELVQKAMQWEIAKYGIGIETNPSSNWTISTFSRYDEHPIVKFFNNGLTANDTALKECPQLWVSINTDDPGIFDTKLENEYAFMARALEKKKNDKGEYIYSKSMIYDWLDKIREMGLRQSFLNPNDPPLHLEDSKNDNIHSRLFRKDNFSSMSDE